MIEKIKEVIRLYEGAYDRLNGVFIFTDKPYDVDFASILFRDNIFHFEFCDDNLDDFDINVDEIKDIKFDKVSHITVSILELINGEAILIHNL